LDRHWQVLIDLMLNRCRTTVNVFSSTCVAVVTARSEGETGVLSG
jgi:Na+/H+-dicarboxylate symporter